MDVIERAARRIDRDCVPLVPIPGTSVPARVVMDHVIVYAGDELVEPVTLLPAVWNAIIKICREFDIAGEDMDDLVGELVEMWGE